MSESTKKGRKTLNALHHPVVDFWRREVGGIFSRNFSNRFSASENLVMRLKRYRKLGRNEANLSSVSFNDEGGVLLAGEDDRGVTLWDWERGKMKLSVPLGQNNVIFDAKFMPLSNDRSIVTCAGYGGVRHVSLGEGRKVETSGLSRHRSPRKIAIEPGSPQIFYTCGNHGLVQHFDLRIEAPTNLFTCEPVRGKRGCADSRLDAIAIDPRNCNLLAVGGNIDGFARLYDIRKCQCDGRAVDHFCPPNLIDNSRVGIAGLAFSEQSELLVSYYQEFIYVFARDMGLGQNPIPVVSKSKSTSPKDHILCSVPLVYKGHKNSYALRSVKFFGPSSEYVLSGSECGRIFIWRKKDGELIRVMRADRFNVITSIEPHPHIPVLASLSGCGDLKLWTPTATKRATLPKKKRQV